MFFKLCLILRNLDLLSTAWESIWMISQWINCIYCNLIYSILWTNFTGMSNKLTYRPISASRAWLCFVEVDWCGPWSKHNDKYRCRFRPTYPFGFCRLCHLSQPDLQLGHGRTADSLSGIGNQLQGKKINRKNNSKLLKYVATSDQALLQ